MRPRRATPDEVAETARRRLELLTVELAALRQEVGPADPAGTVGPEDRQHEDGQHEDRQQDDPPWHAPVDREGGPRVPGVPVGPGRHARRPVGLGARTGGWLHDRLPPTLQGRAGLGPGAVSVVALLVAVGLAVTAWWVVRADSGVVVPTAAPVETVAPLAPEVAEPAPPPVPGTSDAGVIEAGVAAGSAGPAGGGVVVVDVTGKVRRRGIVTLPLGSRVVDALDEAGGPRRGVDLTTLNLARVLVDGEQIVVGRPAPAGVAASAVSGPSAPVPTALLNLNLATEVELETLPGVGPVTAAAIVAWRADHGPFSSVDELLEVSGIGDARLADIAPHVTL